MFIKDNRFIDNQGRTLWLRGCNVSGSSKVPLVPRGETWRRDSLQKPDTVSFVGRPFHLETADEHLDRLASWGFNLIRLIVTWEAIEHAGPGIYDEEYLAYLRKIVKKCEERGIWVYMDPHQDVWSRWTGGDGAPAWTLEKVGIRLDRIGPTGAALTHQELGDPIPKMMWPTNYNRYAAATMFTLFFAGNTYAPACTIDGQSAQDWLQERYIAAFRHCYRRLKDCKAIIGWGAMNEPHQGFIGYQDLTGLKNNSIALGPIPSAFQAMAAASGYPMRIPVYKTGIFGTRITGFETINNSGTSLFQEGFTCPWKLAGVWGEDQGKPVLLKKDYFATYQKRPVCFTEDFLKPFIKKFRERMNEVNVGSFVFIEGIPNGAHPSWQKEDGTGAVHAFHWYDGATLFSKTFNPHLSVRADNRKLVFGKKAVLKSFIDQLADDIQWAKEHMNNAPCLLGEFGLPFDLFNKKAYKTGNYHRHIEALDMYYKAIESLFLHATIWNYTPDNTHARGDGWNDEDLSIFSEGSPRAMEGWHRPFPRAIAGTPEFFSWNYRRKEVQFIYRTSTNAEGPTEIYLHTSHVGQAPKIEVAAFPTDRQELEAQTTTEATQYAWDRDNSILYVIHPERPSRILVHIQG
ncbi:cellulase family glycosylhydrolase [Gracilinema caldarium]|uniref:Glycoside hydrolase family 5 n=1 Tax=Gracilinema caldarium (strain ATCC 51460 / DSM 7334 / H1) TaxID=744872 RepID=F8EY12_GRAC1|nr:cellulase family glycosylhydrolase [Gracilinema caldarium]AEJ20673.1 glycoside hydrolase family 5 [Gracilinema caldarium DSM 7334]